MDIRFCVKCGYKDKFEGDCPNCGSNRIRTLSGERICSECLWMIPDRDKDRVFMNSYHCLETGHMVSHYTSACNSFKDKLVTED